MERWQELHTQTEHELTRAGIPRQILRQALGRFAPAVGASVLVAGCGRGELASYLSLLGYRVTGFTESAEEAAAARRTARKAEIIYGTAAHLPSFDHKFHIVIARGLSSYDCSLFDSGSLRTTASLMSTLRPGGRLVFLERESPRESSQHSGHRAPCFARHLESFPGKVDAPETAVDPSRRSWTPWFLRTPSDRFVVAALNAPAEHYSREEWLQFAANSRIGKRSVCCSWAETISRPAVRRAAA